MKWQKGRRSGNIIDARGVKTAAGGGAGLLVMAVVVALMGGDPTALLVEGVSRSLAPVPSSTLSEDQQATLLDFSSAVLADTEDTWRAVFQSEGLSYKEPKLVVFSGAVDSACGTATSAIGPFYCPYDSKLYLDLDFFHELHTRLGAPGDLAQAYVIAHEIGHHVQNLTGDLSAERSNAQSVKTELMADCYAGIWAHHAQAKGILEDGDFEEAIGGAAAVGDDRLQEQARGYAVPDSFTHGSSAQRMAAFTKGFEAGTMAACR